MPTVTLSDVIEASLGRSLDSIGLREASDVADVLRGIVAALPATSPADAHLAGQLIEAAALLELGAGVDDVLGTPFGR